MSLRSESDSNASGWSLPDELRMLAEMGDAETVREVIHVFQSDTEARIGRIASAVAADNTEKARSEAHAIKGSAGQVGAARVSAIAKEMEAAAGRRDLAEVRRLLAELESAFAAVRRDMSKAE